MRAAAFIDRDGTVIQHVHHLAEVSQVHVLPAAATGIRRLREAGLAAVVITNQSVVGRGLLDEDGLDEIHRFMHRQLAELGAPIDGVYWCGHAPTGEDEEVSEHPDRKPAPGMLLRAAADLDLALGRSWMVGDSLRDILAGRAAGCRGSILVRSGVPTAAFEHHPAVDRIAADLDEAARIIVAQHLEGTGVRRNDGRTKA